MSKQKKIPLLAALIMALCALVFSLYWYGYGRYFEHTDNAYLQSEVTGISSRLSGYVREVRVTDNQRVQAGQIIALLDEREFRNNLAKAEAALQLEQASAGNLEATRTQQLSLIHQAEAKVASVEAEALRAGQQVSRLAQLKQHNYSSQDSLDEAQANQKVAQAQLLEARSALQAARDNLKVLDAEQQEAVARIAQSKATLAQAELDLAYTEIKAPADGIIGRRALRAGMYVQSGMQVASLVPLREVWVEANFKETQLAHMQPGQQVEVVLDAYPDQPVMGIIDSLAPATGAKFALLPPENATGNFTKIVQRVPVKIHIPEPGPLAGKLLPGLSSEVTVDTRSASDASALLAAKR
ncbi:HlyD family secretion protein [Aeromonas simiae]|uniref:HlyD family secretion protein n=1 Tax=Aeromonas simiae TaxID=218936 RepID=UPI00266D6AF5|nr:HlyD family secretion protein [Aeromonas simiae]MDO2949032.1 HlyD family secretion protein [Aeromonas simiae]MDO2952519.1 HlyD family secretion protein [Aeromonas simiae]MDO2957337.1 HlyD family secretion protein [Aeromonas simiae]